MCPPTRVVSSLGKLVMENISRRKVVLHHFPLKSALRLKVIRSRFVYIKMLNMPQLGNSSETLEIHHIGNFLFLWKIQGIFPAFIC